MDLQITSFTIFSAFLVFIFMLLKIWSISATSTIAPPGPWKLPFVGNVHQMISSLPHQRLRDLAVKYGRSLIHLQLGEVSHFVVSSADVAKQVMKTHDTIFARRPYLLAANILSYNSTSIAFAPYGEYWRQMRKICTLELLSARRVQAAVSIREQEVAKLIESISSTKGSKINLSEKLSSLTIDIVAKAAFGGIHEEHGRLIPLLREMIELGAGYSLTDLFPSIKIFHMISGMEARLEKLHSRIDKILENIISEHKVKRVNSDTEVANDLLDVLLNVQDSGGFEFQLTTDNIKAVILDILLAGSDTTSTTLEWAMSELLKNSNVMEVAQAEVRLVFDTKGYVDEAGLAQLKFLKLVIKETLRLHPPLPLLLPRESSEICQIAGYEIPLKSKVIINAWVIGRDPKYWPEAERFNPERFLNGSIDYKGVNFEYIPFGAGRRICPGMSFGTANVELTLAKLLYHFDWKLPDCTKNEDLDMSETSAAVVRRKNDLLLVPIPYHPRTVT
ncbi:premnaspirodiene oxygenase-like [Tripterygium wilfordii]|uniref:premnaspirodiene oxygenase-like n=1 Tax=Tripterygium wilfordii TaxID=458696 RepID=UPI0018F84F07|nr:premnaspirodiene oxygenase-like [Tripterygium wilfordii]